MSENTEQIFTERVLCNYNNDQKYDMECSKIIITTQIRRMKKNGKINLFGNQEFIAYSIVAAFKLRNIINVMIVSKTQSGKTGSMCATIEEYLKAENNLIPIEK